MQPELFHRVASLNLFLAGYDKCLELWCGLKYAQKSFCELGPRGASARLTNECGCGRAWREISAGHA
ncbi:hypothetical protein KDAU_16310 [Dictyobacter aurantiacus]|uniref:Uncharacterized protein n=1 Tax=Dictyobacter aurantiacus TaxID=1936993 RepID=A0A401ZBT8_9CHLR|nr:hypothetical protein KDAU_16310 [Dictyobacter aurantiacus]